MESRETKVGNVIIGGCNPIVVQTMCNTHTSDVEASVEQCVRLYEAGAQLIRLTVPSLGQVESLRKIKEELRSRGIDTPLVADVHFSSEIAIAVAEVVEKVRINPGNFHKDHQKAREQFARLVEVCKENGTAIRIGLNHGSLGERITNLYGNTPLAMKEAVMEWLDMCVENDFYNVVVSLKASNTFVMVEAYRLLANEMQKKGVVFPLHLGVTEAGNGDAGRIKSAVGISALLSEGIGDTIRVSLTE
ncbi:MAG: (E)-4-hydroxy-3-methylbut-2-enyl-diphosphate synthase, partial [Bacteroidales bacterium]|nr:(E)-4-hydroxy-3-methylbut-2-enyl-diphosphate synthase [Bacteroidales bacterium]